VVDVLTAKGHGICPKCEGYGGNGADGCVNGDCTGSCPACWCPGCHDGHVPIPEPGGGLLGSWEAYAHLHPQDDAECGCDYEVLPGGTYPERRYLHGPDCPRGGGPDATGADGPSRARGSS
jgi:hypothetical protein